MSPLDRLIRALLLRRKHAAGLATLDSRRQFLRTMVVGGVVLPFTPDVLERVVLSTPEPSGMMIGIRWQDMMVTIRLHPTLELDENGHQIMHAKRSNDPFRVWGRYVAEPGDLIQFRSASLTFPRS